MSKKFCWLWAGLFFYPFFILAQTWPPGVPVLLYHKITPNSAELSKVCCTLLTKDFEKQLDYLTQHGYQTINPDQLYDYLTNNVLLPAKPVMLTFDDFHPSDYKIVLPLLLERNFTGTFFVPSSYVQEGPTRQVGLLALAKAGMEIESHTVYHYFMAKVIDRNKPMKATLRPETSRRELIESKRWLEKTLNKEVNYLAWPGGAFNEDLIKMAKESGYKGLYLARSTCLPYLRTYRDNNQSFFNIYGLDSPDYIKRIDVDTFLTFADWQYIMEHGNLPKK